MAREPIDQLRRAIAADRLAHAWAFIGPEGSGRTWTALAFAQILLCERSGPGAPAACGRCRGCALAAARQHPDLHVIEPTPPETNPKGPRVLRIGAVRELERQASLRPALARHKVFILEDAERMTGDAPQAFLKTLEEPPARTVIVLVLPRARALPATVLSRCQVVRFPARADPRRAADRAEALEILAEVRAKGVETLFRRSGTVDRDRERAERLVDAYWFYYRDLLVAGSGGPLGLLGDPERAEEIAREARTWSVDDILRGLDTCRRARQALAVNVSPRLTLEIILSRLARLAA
jgi:DNA polymerase III subunit delta'